MLTTQAEQAVEQIDLTIVEDYKKYWETIKPATDKEYFMRWIFAFLSVHASWEANIVSYNTLAENYDNWINDEESLKRLLVESRIGLYKMRSKGIWEFRQAYEKDPTWWRKRDNESWVECRDRIMCNCFGLGHAKTAFALELCSPNECEAACLDTHMLQLYGHSPSKLANVNKGIRYREMEGHWVNYTKQKGIPSFIARSIYWDIKQKKTDSRYWSIVLETQ